MNNPFNITNSCVFWLIPLLLLPFLLSAQSKSISSENSNLLNLLAEHVATGNKIALRDLAKLWDATSQNAAVTQILKRHTLFTKTEWDWENVSKKQSFLHFFYQNEQRLNFSELLQAFYLSPVEKRATTFELIPKNIIPTDPFSIRKIMQNIEQYLKKKDTDNLLIEIEKLGGINNPVITQSLKGLMDNKTLKSFKSQHQESIFVTIIDQLPDSLAFDYLLKLTREAILPFAYCQRKLANISNNFIDAHNHQTLYGKYIDLWTSLRKDLAALKTYGYQKEQLTPEKFFKEKVDYFAWIAAISKDSLFWVKRNAALDMLKTHHPRVLFYLAALQFRVWRQGIKTEENYLDLLHKHISVKLKVYGQKDWTDNYESSTSQLNFLIYWANYWNDYEWNNYQLSFTNKKLALNELNDYDRLFRRLNSSNDSIAKQAFQFLSIGNPGEIRELTKQYKPLLRNYNHSLPPFKYKILEQLSQLTDFCKKNNISWWPNKQLLKKLEALENPLPPKDRYKRENELIHTLTYFDLTPLEYYATANAQNLELNYSIARILDYSYARFWSAILSNERNLRFYLLKMQLFKELGGFGVVKKYANKIDIHSPETVQLLKSLEKLETDNRIKTALNDLLADLDELEPSAQLAKFLVTPETTSKKILEKLPPPTLEKWPQLLRALFLHKDKQAIKKLEQYIELHFGLANVPLLFEIPKKQWIEHPLAGAALVQLLENSYNYTFAKEHEISTTKWWTLWEEKSNDYLQWEKLLFERQLSKLTTDKTLIINDINQITQSTLYNDQYRTLCLKSLQKINNERRIYHLKIKPKISAQKELHYLKGISFSYRELDDLYKITEIDAPELLLDFIEQNIQHANLEEQSTLYSNLFRQQWFYEFVTTGKISMERANRIKIIFQKYLNEAAFLTEFEEQNTQLNILMLNNSNKTLKEKLEQIVQDSINEKMRYKYLESVLTSIKFHELIVAFPILKNGTFPNQNPFSFLNRDFGLPIFKFENDNLENQFFQILSTHTEYECYLKTLQAFGLDILGENGALGFQKIYDLLQFDLLIPFLGEGGQIRDYYVYGLVKLLELHFKTTLGFSQKLNENQNFYHFTSAGRAAAWQKYLIENQLAKDNGKLSFTLSSYQ